MESINSIDLHKRLLEYSKQVGFDTQKESFREVISFLTEIDENFVYSLLSPEEANYVSLHREHELLLKKRLEGVVSKL